MKKKIACIILAAGKSTRMKSTLPKVLHPICGRPIMEFTLDLVKSLKVSKSVAVVGYKHQQVKGVLAAHGVEAVLQKRLLGTADAVKTALKKLRGFKGDILVLYGDTPLLSSQTIRKLLDFHAKSNSHLSVLTAIAPRPAGYGRILRDEYSGICGIAEEKDADDFQKEIKEINTGIMVFKKDKLQEALRYIKANNRKKEYYLTDAVEILYKRGALVDGLRASDINETLGVNSRLDLASAAKIMRKRINRKIAESGVTIVDPDSCFIDYGVKIGQDTTIYPFTVIENNVKIGNRCKIGPFIHLREGTRLENDCVIGNFIEVVRSRIGSGTLAKHFSYLGDTQIGKLVNIGAGCVTANWDGSRKNKTKIKDKAFIGSDTVIVAPAVIGKQAKTGAGSVVLKNTFVGNRSVVVGVPAVALKKVSKRKK